MKRLFKITMAVKIVHVRKVVSGHVGKSLAQKHVRSLVIRIIKHLMDYTIIFLVNVNIY